MAPRRKHPVVAPLARASSPRALRAASSVVRTLPTAAFLGAIVASLMTTACGTSEPIDARADDDTPTRTPMKPAPTPPSSIGAAATIETTVTPNGPIAASVQVNGEMPAVMPVSPPKSALPPASPPAKLAAPSPHPVAPRPMGTVAPSPPPAPPTVKGKPAIVVARPGDPW